MEFTIKEESANLCLLNVGGCKVSRTNNSLNYIIERPLTAVLRKGKGHYLCRYRFDDFLKNIRMYPEKYKTTIETLEQMSNLRAGIDLDRYRISGAIKSRICIKGTCAGCARKKECT